MTMTDKSRARMELVAEAVAKGINELGWSPDVPASTGINEFEGNSHECMTIAGHVLNGLLDPQANAALLDECANLISKYKEYFSAIENGEYTNNRRTAPLRDYEVLMQDRATELLSKLKEVRG